MARIARVVVADVAHHITQRGDGRQFILADDAGRRVYLDLLRRAVGLHGVSVLGYCLMSNHVHVVAIPRRAELGTAEVGYRGGRRSLPSSAVLNMATTTMNIHDLVNATDEKPPRFKI